jgi:hypothetical protein
LLPLVGCTVNRNPKDTTAVTSSLSESETAGETTGLVPENFGNEDGSPRDFVILVRKSRYDYIWAKETTGDRINDSAYERNMMLEELYNIRIKIAEAAEDSSAYFSNTILAGTGEYDLVVHDYWWGLERKGLYQNLLDFSEIDTDDSYWYTNWNKNTTINGKLFSIVGDAALEVVQNLEIVFFNKSIATDNGLDLYKTVNDNNWTIEKMLTICSATSKNLNNDNTEDDVYGALYDFHSSRSQLFAAGLVLTKPTQNGFVEICANTEKNINICNAVTKLIHDMNVRYDTNTARSSSNKGSTIFSNGNALFYATALYLGKTLRANAPAFNYGIIPMPKYDADSDYISTTYGASVFAIPLSVNNPHMSAVVLDAMNALSNDTIVYSFYDIVMKSQIADAPEDADMIDMARANLYVDFEFINELGLISAFQTAVANNANISSALKALSNVAETKLTDLLKSYN